jgi:hypothetical protein
MVTPSGQVIVACLVILQATKGGHGAIERRMRGEGVRLANGEISPQDRQQHFHEFRLAQHRLRRAIQTTELFHELGVRQSMDRRMRGWDLRGPAAGEEQVHRMLVLTERMRELKTDQGAHAMPEERKWPIKIGSERMRQGLHKGSEPNEWWFHQSVFPSG